MRTTVDIPDALYRELKSRAAHEGRSVKELILRGAESQLQPAAVSRRSLKKRSAPPVLQSKEPGTLDLDNERISDLIGFP